MKPKEHECRAKNHFPDRTSGQKIYGTNIMVNDVIYEQVREMVEARGRKGWSDLAALDEACGINSAELLAERMADEISDIKLEPRLVDLLLRQEE
mgnify:CR=1 FL=1